MLHGPFFFLGGGLEHSDTRFQFALRPQTEKKGTLLPLERPARSQKGQLGLCQRGAATKKALLWRTVLKSHPPASRARTPHPLFLHTANWAGSKQIKESFLWPGSVQLNHLSHKEFLPNVTGHPGEISDPFVWRNVPGRCWNRKST